ncbi:MAG: MFS transporter [Spirochaetes bacterium]|nr:MFS transporter [Spirochaetota bacterium]MBU0955264.1 MFS transporter [Spirochaetota bacterium]
MEKPGTRIKFGFGIGDLGGNLFFTIIGFYLLYFMTDVAKLPAALAGTVLLAGKIWDAVTDPITGYLSDNTRSRWGRRRPFMFVGSLLAFVGMIFMFTVPETSSQTGLFWLLLLWFCLLNTAYTLVNIPYMALLPELTSDFDQRTVLTGYRMGFAVIGTFIGAGAVMPLVGLFGSERTGWSVMGAIMGAIMLATAMVTIWAIREPDHSSMPRQRGSFVSTYIRVLGMKVFLQALIPWTLFITGTTMIQGALVYYFKYIFNNEALFQVALLLLLSFSLLCIPLWVKISQKIGKNHSYNIGMLLMSAAVLFFALLGESLGPFWALAAMVLGGIGLSTHYVMPHSILPDIVEYDAVHNGGMRREGVFSSLWTFSSKIGQALALALNGWLLALFRYDPAVLPDRVTITGIKLVCGPIPVLFYIAGVLILYSYPISRQYYARMLEQQA